MNLKILIYLAVIILVGLFCYLIKSKEVFEITKLTGKYGVGYAERYLVDDKRQEPNDLKTKRKLMIYVWYPSNVDKNELVNFYQAKDIEELKISLKKRGFKDKDLNQLNNVYSHAVKDGAMLENSTFPVLLFSHGYLGTSAKSYAHIFEELASHGYIVVSIAHTYFGAKVEFPDGSAISPKPEKYTQETMPGEEDQKIWIEDVQFVLNELQKINNNKSDKFYKYFDMNNIGYLGHSFGGLIAFYIYMKDERVKAGINLDQLPYLDNIISANIKKPFMFIMSESFNKSDDELAQLYNSSVDFIKEHRKKNKKEYEFMDKNESKILNSKSGNLSYKIIPNLLHNGFTDVLVLKEFPFYKNNKNIIDIEAMSGKVEGFDTAKILNSYILNFFDKYLKTESQKMTNNQLVEVNKVIPNIEIDLRYATKNNFTKNIIYNTAQCYLIDKAAEALKQASAEFNKLGYKIKVWDAYRPLRAQHIFWKLVPDTRYVADPNQGSRHNRGCAIDLTLVDLNGKELDMGTEFDEFTEKIHRDYKNFDKEILNNRKILQEIMEKNNFIGWKYEWWHFDYKDWEKYPVLDIPFEEI